MESANCASMSLYTYFHKTTSLPNPQGPLSRWIPSSCIESTDKQVSAEFAAPIQSAITTTTRGPYNKYTPKEKGEIASYPVQHGTSRGGLYSTSVKNGQGNIESRKLKVITKFIS